MNIYVWVCVAPVADRYHDSGGVLVAARDLQEARALWRDYATEEELDHLDALDEKPDFEWHGAKAKKGEIVVFPDSGCC